MLPMVAMYGLLGKEAIDLALMIVEGIARALRAKSKKKREFEAAKRGDRTGLASDDAGVSAALLVEPVLEDDGEGPHRQHEGRYEDLGSESSEDPLLAMPVSHHDGDGDGDGDDDDDDDDDGADDFAEEIDDDDGGDDLLDPAPGLEDDWGDVGTKEDELFRSGKSMSQAEARARVLAAGGGADILFDRGNDDSVEQLATAKRRAVLRRKLIHTGKGGAAQLYEEINRGLTNSHSAPGQPAVAAVPPQRKVDLLASDDKDDVFGLL